MVCNSHQINSEESGLVFLWTIFPARARAVTGRQCPHSGEGKTFWRVDRDVFTKTAITRDKKVEKSLPPHIGSEPDFRPNFHFYLRKYLCTLGLAL